jgi:hypothetical protein
MLIAFSETAEYQLKHPSTDEPLVDKAGKPMIAVIYGKQSSQYKNASNAMLKKVKKHGNKKDVSLDDIENDAIELIAACVKEFKNLHIEYLPGEFLDPKDIQGTLTKAWWIREQLNKEIVNLSNFLMAS